MTKQTHMSILLPSCFYQVQHGHGRESGDHTGNETAGDGIGGLVSSTGPLLVCIVLYVQFDHSSATESD